MKKPGIASTLDPEFQTLVRARYSGNPQAMMELGARLAVGNNAPFAPVDGAALLMEAASQGSARAWSYVAVLAAAGVGRSQNWSESIAALGSAADLGELDAAAQLELLRELRIQDGGDAQAWLAATGGQILSSAPRLIAHEGFLTPALCSHLIERSTPRLTQAQVYDAARGGLKTDPMRTSTGAAFSLIDTDVIMQLIRARIARTAAVAFPALEPMEVLHYAVGECYKPHVDFFHPALPNFSEQMRDKGQRVKTCLVYLNDDYDGGETDFPRLRVKFRGRTGEALVFENVLANGTGDMRTLHTGLPPARGEKWLLSQWMRSKPQPVV